MKIKGIYIIPLVAIMIAMFTIGITPGFASDTTASDTLTFVPPTEPETSSLEEEIGGFVSGAFGDELEQAGDSIVSFSGIMSQLLNSFRNILNAIIRIFQIGGGMMGDGGVLGGLAGNLGGGLLG